MHPYLRDNRHPTGRKPRNSLNFLISQTIGQNAQGRRTNEAKDILKNRHENLVNF